MRARVAVWGLGLRGCCERCVVVSSLCSEMPPKKKGGKGKKAAAPELTGPEAEAEMERKLLIEEAKALKKRKEVEEVQFNEFQQEKVRCDPRASRLPRRCSPVFARCLGDGPMAATATTTAVAGVRRSPSERARAAVCLLTCVSVTLCAAGEAQLLLDRGEEEARGQARRAAQQGARAAGLRGAAPGGDQGTRLRQSRRPCVPLTLPLALVLTLTSAPLPSPWPCALPPPQVYKQRVKHLLYEHQDESTRHKTSAQVSMKMAQGEHREAEAELKRDKRQLKVELKELQLKHEDFMKSLKLVRDAAA